METNLKQLVLQCEQELCDRESAFLYHRQISGAWEELVCWMNSRGRTDFNESIGYEYCNEVLGSTVLSGVSKKDQRRLRAIRMLISYQRDGDFEYRTPTVSYEFKGHPASIWGNICFISVMKHACPKTRYPTKDITC